MPARKPANERKAEIVDQMLRLADEVGPDRLTTQTVADTVGLSQPAIFRHFPTKQALWRAVAETISDRLISAWTEVLNTSTDPMRRIEGLVCEQLRQIEAMPAIPTILFSRELQAENDDLRLSVLALMTNLVTTLTDEFAKGQKSGLFRSDLAPKDGAYLLVSLVQGLAIRWTLGKRGFRLEAEGRRLLATQMKLFQTAMSTEEPS